MAVIRKIRKMLFHLWYVLAVFLIVFALLVSVMRLLTPYANAHLPAIEEIAIQKLQRPVTIGGVTVDWHRLSPELGLYKVVIFDPGTHKPKLSVGAIRIDFSILKSIWYRQAYVRNITVAGVALRINQQDPDVIKLGEITSINVKDSLTQENVQPDPMIKWIFSQPRLALEDIHLLYSYKELPERSITLRYLALRNIDDQHFLKGHIRLNQATPTDVRIEFNWDGDVKNLMASRAQVHLNLGHFSVSEWLGKFNFYGINLKEGLADGDFWMDWLNNRPTQIKCDFQIENLKLHSTVTGNDKLMPLMQGSVAWRQDENSQDITGNQIQIYFENHHWEPLDFHVVLNADASGHYFINSVKASYFDITDAADFLTDTTILTEDTRKLIESLDPQGVVQNVEASLPGDLTDYAHMNIGLGLKDIAFNAWGKFPKVTNLSGDFSWNGNEAEINLDSKDLLLTIAQVFPNTLRFNHVRGYAELWNQHGAWTVTSEDIHVDNKDMQGDAQFSLSFPANSSPVIDLNGTVSVHNARAVYEYLPTKTFDKALEDWLRNAFLSGSADSVTAIVQGPLSDFPFDTKPGKFLITGNVKDVQLNFDKAWPQLSHLYGVLTFSGAQMIADVSSGDLMGIPLHNIRGVIPYIGVDKPQILEIKGQVNGDMARAMEFINKSPLRATIGKELENMELSGPMQLKLGLSIPLGNPDNTRVMGLVNVINGKIDMPMWKLTLNRLVGNFQFTESTLQSDQIKGELFNSPVTLGFTTLDEPNKQHQIRIDMQSKISIATLQDWMGFKLDKIASGETDLTTQIFMASENNASSDHLVISSDLIGVAVNAPDPLGKLINAKRQLQIDMDLRMNPMKLKIDYDNALSAALTLSKTDDHLALRGGELHIGTGSANSNMGTGILLTCNLPTIDVAKWQKYMDSVFPSNKKRDSNLQLRDLQGVQLTTNTLILPKLTLHNVNLHVVYQNGNLNLSGTSNEISGNAMVPADLRGEIKGSISQLNLMNFDTKKAGGSLDPRTIPDLTFNVNNIRYNDFQVNQVVLSTARTSSGMSIRSITINDGVSNLTASGSWNYSGGRSRTNLSGNFNTNHIARVLSNWGFRSSNLVGNYAKATFNLNWDSAPYSFDLKTLDGDLSITLGAGTIIHLSESSNAKLGMGRMLNVLSLTSLPSTFKGTFEQGYVFDNMSGTFQIQNGNLFTQDMQFSGPVAGITIKGRIGLAAEDFDMRMNVTPYVTGSLPAIAAFAGGPVVGIGALLLDKMISAAKIITYHYSVTGTWSNPNWQPLGSSPARQLPPMPAPTHSNAGAGATAQIS